MANEMNSFHELLVQKLVDLNLDTDVYSEYILSILEEDISNDEKLESMEEFLSEQVDEPKSIASELLHHWSSANCAAVTDCKDKVDTKSVDSKLTDIFSNVQTVTKHKTLSSEEKIYKQQILDKYSNVADGDSDDDGGSEEGDGCDSAVRVETAAAATHSPLPPSDSLPPAAQGGGGNTKKPETSRDYTQHALDFKNVNADKVSDSEREKRAKAKVESERKKEQDKMNKEKQKQKVEERKEKEKKRTQKQERRRM